MFENYLKSALRSMTRDGGLSITSLIGLSVAIMVLLVIFLFVRHEVSFDQHLADAERMYRVVADVRIGERELTAPMTPGPLAHALVTEYSMVETACRVNRSPRAVARGADRFWEDGVLFVDAGCLEFFGLSMRGHPAKSALAKPQTLVLSKDAAIKYFGAEDPIGKVLDIGGEPYTVTAVTDSPHRSHLDFSILATLAGTEGGPWIDSWLANNFYTYIKLTAAPDQLEPLFPELIASKIGPVFGPAMGTTFEQFEASGGYLRYFLQPVTDIHLRSHLEHELAANGSIQLIYVLSTLALLVLMLSCINYVNFSAARSARRSKEVGVRKSMGAEPGQIRVQFLLESVFIALAAALAAVAAAVLLLPVINDLLAMQFTPFDVLSWDAVLLLIGVVTIVGVGSGAYPALLMSTMPPVSMVGGRFRSGIGAQRLKKILVGFQFAVATGMIMAVLAIHAQSQFLVDKELGFDPDDVLVLNRANLLGDAWETARAEIARIPGVEAASASSTVPGRVVREVFFGKAGGAGDEMETAWLLSGDSALFDVLRIRRTTARVDGLPAWEPGVSVISTTARDRLGWDAAIGRTIEISARPTEPTVVGVVEDLHIQSLHQPIRPAVIRPLEGVPGVITLRLRPKANRAAVLRASEVVWRSLSSTAPFDPVSLTEEIRDLYAGEERVLRVTAYLSVVALMIACLGLLGLAAYTAQQRSKEIALRKVVGAMPEHIVALLARDYLRLALVGGLIAIPLTVWLVQLWLQSFAYRIELQWFLPAIAAAVTTGAALTTVAYQALRSATARPAETLRQE